MKAAEAKIVSVRTVHADGQASLVEWMDDDGNYHRAVVPTEIAKDGLCEDRDLAAGIPYPGYRWSELFKGGMSEKLEQELYRQGVWTKEDALAHSERVRAAVQKVLVVPLVAEILAVARKE